MSNISDDGKCVVGERAPENSIKLDWGNLTFPVDAPEISIQSIAIKMTFYSVAFMLDIVGNSIVTLIILMNKRMRTTTNLLILNLAISDIMVGTVCMPVHAGNSITKEWPFGNFVCKFSVFMQVAAVTSSILTLTAISMERFFAIIYPIKRRKAPRYIAFIVIIVNWFIAIAMASPLLVVSRSNEIIWENRHQVWCDEEWPRYFTDSKHCSTKMPGEIIYYTIVIVVMYCMPIVVMVCAYSVILVNLLLRKRPGTVISATNQAQLKYKKKVIRMLVAVLVVFVVCWSPQQGMILWEYYRDENPDYIETVKYVAVHIAYWNSALNPILYGGFNENFRKGFKDVFRCKIFRKRNAVGPWMTGQEATSRRNNQASECTTQMGTSNI